MDRSSISPGDSECLLNASSQAGWPWARRVTSWGLSFPICKPLHYLQCFFQPYTIMQVAGLFNPRFMPIPRVSSYSLGLSHSSRCRHSDFRGPETRCWQPTCPNNERIGLPRKGNETPKKCPRLWKGRRKRERLFILLRFKHSRTLPRHRISWDQGNWRPARLAHIWKMLDREVSEVRAYMSSRDISICFWERRKLANTANKPKGWIKLNPSRGNRHRLDGPEYIFFSFPLSFYVCACVCHKRGTNAITPLPHSKTSLLEIRGHLTLEM